MEQKELHSQSASYLIQATAESEILFDTFRDPFLLSYPLL